jgi:hypothetical protein
MQKTDSDRLNHKYRIADFLDEELNRYAADCRSTGFSLSHRPQLILPALH